TGHGRRGRASDHEVREHIRFGQRSSADRILERAGTTARPRPRRSVPQNTAPRLGQRAPVRYTIPGTPRETHGVAVFTRRLRSRHTALVGSMASPRTPSTPVPRRAGPEGTGLPEGISMPMPFKSLLRPAAAVLLVGALTIAPVVPAYAAGPLDGVGGDGS